MQKRPLAFLALALVLISPALRAETLDDATITGIYAAARAAVHDADRTRKLMGERLDDNFILKSEIVRAVGDQPPQKAEETKTKAEAIRDQISGMTQMNMEDYDNKVTGIEYSKDRKQALVNDESTSSGTISIPNNNGEYSQVRYAARETCADTLALVKGAVKIMKSQCSDQVAVGN